MEAAQSAIAQAQQSQAKATAEARSPGSSSSPGEADGKPTPDNQTHEAIAQELKRSENWGKLPKQLARKLRNAEKERVPKEYEQKVKAYFKLIAEQSQKETNK